jgi:hypothetical protein
MKTKPGRELDALIAEKVFKNLEPMDVVPLHIPHYSTDIAAAWLVVEKLRELNFSSDVSSYPTSRKWLKPPHEGALASSWTLQTTKECYQCCITRYEVDFGGWIVVCDPVADTAPHAICLAALKAMNIKE